MSLLKVGITGQSGFIRYHLGIFVSIGSTLISAPFMPLISSIQTDRVACGEVRHNGLAPMSGW